MELAQSMRRDVPRRLTWALRCLLLVLFIVAGFATRSAALVTEPEPAATATGHESAQIVRLLPLMPGDVAIAQQPAVKADWSNSVSEHPDVPPILGFAEEPAAAVMYDTSHMNPRELACSRWAALISDGKEWDSEVVVALMWRESRCSPFAVSPTNDWGLLQINATCWAGSELGGLPQATELPPGVRAVVLRCDEGVPEGVTAQWCYRAKASLMDNGTRPASPCDLWLDPQFNIDVAYRLWLAHEWRPWCFNEASRSSHACDMASD